MGRRQPLVPLLEAGVTKLGDGRTNNARDSISIVRGLTSARRAVSLCGCAKGLVSERRQGDVRPRRGMLSCQSAHRRLPRPRAPADRVVSAVRCDGALTTDRST